MEWCITHHIRAKYIETTLQCTEIKSAQMQSRNSTRGSFCLTNPCFSSSFEDNEVNFLSFGVPAKPGIANDLIEANDIGRKAAADFIDSLLVENLSCKVTGISVISNKMLQANKFLRLARSRRNCPICKT